MTKHTKKPEQKKVINPVIGGVVGSVVGAVVGTAVASALNNKETRDKIGEVAEYVKDNALEAIKEVNEEPDGMQSVAKKFIDEAIDSTK